MTKFKYWIEVFGMIIVLLLLLIWYNFFNFNDGLEWDVRAKIGDSFGSLNALFSGLALAGIVFTILLQRKELSLQRDELRETRKEFQIQNKTLKIQRFENTFFNLLSLHHKIVDSIDYQKKVELKSHENYGFKNIKERLSSSSNSKTLVLNNVSGRDVFRDKFFLLKEAVNETVESPKSSQVTTYKLMCEDFEPFESNKIKTDFEPVYFEHYEMVKTDFGHYFRNLYRIVKFVNESNLISVEEFEFKDEVSNNEKAHILRNENFKLKYSYLSMLRSQLSDYELGWIFYNCISSNGSEKFKPLINKYALLKNLNWEGFHPCYILTYNESAYKNPLKT